MKKKLSFYIIVTAFLLTNLSGCGGGGGGGSFTFIIPSCASFFEGVA